MQKKRMKKFSICKSIPYKDNEGNTISKFDDPIKDEAIIWPAGGKLQSQMYGLRVNSIINMNYYGNLSIKENDGLCIDSTGNPDYKVISVRKYTKFLFIEAEKRNT